jgi:hypothetical protein
MAGHTQNEPVHFEVRVSSEADVDSIQSALTDQLKQQPDFRVLEVTQITPFGMTGAEIAISFVISLVSSAVVHVYRDEIDGAVSKVSKITNESLRIVYRRPPGSYEVISEEQTE